MRRTPATAARRRRRASALASIGAGLLGAPLGLRLAGRLTGPIGPLQVTVEPRLGPGADVDLPPLGTARLPVHRGPLGVRVSPVGVDVDAGRALLAYAPDAAGKRAARDLLDGVLASSAGQVRDLARRAAIRWALAGLAGSAVTTAVTTRRPLLGLAAGAGALAATTGAAVATVDRDGWRTPALSGLLDRAPQLIGDLRDAPARLGTYRDQLADLLRTATAVQLAIGALPSGPPPDAIRLLHISDIHLSPLALPLARVLVAQYGVDVVADTGDLVDWGTPAEQGFADQIDALGVPYVYVKGNHDSAGIADAVAHRPNAVVLAADREPVTVAGLRFAGMADPRFTPDKTTGDDHAAHKIGPAATAFADAVRGHDVDIALVHSPTAGRALAGLTPLVLAGDIHRRAVQRHDGTTVLVQGTSGGAGLRGVQQQPPVPLAMSVLFLDRSSHRLHSVDEITLDGIGGRGVQVQRRSAADLDATAEPAA